MRGAMTRTAKTLPKTLYDKIWDAHVVNEQDGEAILYIDLHLIHEVTTPQAFAGLRAAGRKVRRPDRTLAVADHNIPTEGQALGVDAVQDEEARLQLKTLARNVADNGIQFFPMGDVRNGIVHVVGPEQGRTQPGMTIVCGDSHTSTHGAFGALAFGIGTSEVEHVLATQTLIQQPAKNMRVLVEGRFAEAEVFVRALAALRPQAAIYTANAHNDVSFGALRLVDPHLRPHGELTRVEPLPGDLAAYRAHWHAAMDS